jgi:Tol biopolymer transport system component
VLFTSNRTKINSLWVQPADGGAAPELAFQFTEPLREAMFTPDGRAIVARADTPDSNRDLYLLPLEGDRKPVPVLTSPDDEKEPRVSPDGKWLAYVSNESGREEVYVRALAKVAGRVPVSTGGGGEPLWAPDGKRIYYRIGTTLMAASVATSPALAVIAREKLFDGPFATDVYHPNYDVAPDGKSFVMVRPVEENRQLVMVVNWIQELRRRTGAGR